MNVPDPVQEESEEWMRQCVINANKRRREDDEAARWMNEHPNILLQYPRSRYLWSDDADVLRAVAAMEASMSEVVRNWLQDKGLTQSFLPRAMAEQISKEGRGTMLDPRTW
jgi:hypothetical protein